MTWLQLGDGGVWTTVEDLLLWDNNFYEPKVGGAAMIDTMQTTGRLANGGSTGYALGLSVGSYRGQRSIGHNGSWGGYQAALTRYPDRYLSTAILCNSGVVNTNQLSQRVADIYLPAPRDSGRRQERTRNALSPPAAPLPDNVLSLFSGTFRNPSLPDMQILVDRGKLFFVAAGERFELRHAGLHSFVILGAPAEATITFDAPGNNPAPSFQFHIVGQEPMVVTRASDITVTPAELEAYIGRFFSSELQATYDVAAAEGSLALKARGFGAELFRPSARDEFRAGSTTLRFTRGGSGEVTGYFLDETRSRNIRFDKIP